jgi:predicted DNA-binding protein YlxM (UPF0122 family)
MSNGKYLTTGEDGFTMVWALLAMLLLALASQQVFVSASKQAIREKLLRQKSILTAYQKAIESYRNSSPGIQKNYPMELQDLLIDRRQIQIKRHLRKLYADPLQPQVPVDRAWGIVRNNQGQITSIYSITQDQS